MNLREAAEAFIYTVEHAEAARARYGKGGQHVPFHGDFAHIDPSNATRLAWWARTLQAALNAEKAEAHDPAELDAVLRSV